MSALDTGVKKVETNKVYSFNQDKQIPTYLLGMVVGDLKVQAVSDRVNLITEPGDITKAAYELKQVPQFMTAMESYLTPFAWQSFNVVLLPGTMTSEAAGMENPYLTIV